MRNDGRGEAENVHVGGDVRVKPQQVKVESRLLSREVCSSLAANAPAKTNFIKQADKELQALHQ